MKCIYKYNNVRILHILCDILYIFYSGRPSDTNSDFHKNFNCVMVFTVTHSIHGFRKFEKKNAF